MSRVKIQSAIGAKMTGRIIEEAVDINGYLPTHNTRYQKPITGDTEKDIVFKRNKKI